MSRRGSGRGRVNRRASALVVLIALAALAAVFVVPVVDRVVRDLSFPLQDTSIINRQAAVEHIDPALVAAVIYAETKFDPRTSSAGALGLMQIEPATARNLAHMSGGTLFKVADLAHPATNIAYGSYYLRYLLNQFNDDKLLALAAYNAGETNVDAWVSRVTAKHQRFTVSDIPITQTRLYVAEVMSKQSAYRSHYASQLGYR